jgi:plastocyanin
MKKFSILLTALSLFAINAFAANSSAQNTEFRIVIKNHKFTPENLEVPAGEKIKLIVENQDKTPEEFESHDLNREKIIAGGKSATIFLDSLKPGTYKYVGEFNEETAKGTIIAK